MRGFLRNAPGNGFEEGLTISSSRVCEQAAGALHWQVACHDWLFSRRGGVWTSLVSPVGLIEPSAGWAGSYGLIGVCQQNEESLISPQPIPWLVLASWSRPVGHGQVNSPEPT